MKNFSAILLSLIILVTSGIVFVACSKQEQNNDTPEIDDGAMFLADSPVITDEIKELLKKAYGNMTGISYTPVAYVARQISPGTNCCVLCKAEAVVPNPEAKYVLVYISEDLAGNAEITNTVDSNVSAHYPEGLMGGWIETASPVMTDDAKKALEKACETLTGAEYTPVALLATQVVAGTNYRILCESKPSVPSGEYGYVIVSVYADLEGNAEILETYEFKKPVDEYTENSSVDYESELEKLKAEHGIDDTYRESVDEDFNGYTEYCYTKIDKNGIGNPYDALKVTIDNSTGEVFTKKRFDNAAFIEAKIDEKTAKDKAVETHPKSSVKKCVLEYYMPDYPEGDVLLAYRIEFKDGNVIYVNVVSGDIAGTDQNK